MDSAPPRTGPPRCTERQRLQRGGGRNGVPPSREAGWRCSAPAAALFTALPLCVAPEICSRSSSGKKSEKKFWYDSPTLGSNLIYKPPSFASALKLAPPKLKREDSIRKKTLEVLLFKAVRGVLDTCDAGQEVYDLRLELSKVSLTSDFSVCRIYWKSTGSLERDDYAEKVLQKSTKRIRHILISHQVLRVVPPILFLRDKADAAVREIEKLLAIADFGPEEEKEELLENDFSEQRSTVTDTLPDSGSNIHTNLFGIDHEALNKQIYEYKNKIKVKKIEGIELSEQQQQQLAEVQRQKKLKWKKSKKPSHDISPSKYLMDNSHGNYWDDEVASSQENELEYDAEEDESDVENETTKLK
ncbi:putative ribosome-binding factor A, mitochondrial isoform X2 [Varanus komodoensis]|uniref:putative ribosome-binding factor A, mitochondrial isoform X2 n=1 Tax=Varanus komodoensis TaxID=61221 RepID=UPI001CF7C130|nr:putative ribosome-binding factor A, mitochondrial isoform X2 [Varanus komodoensis]